MIETATTSDPRPSLSPHHHGLIHTTSYKHSGRKLIGAPILLQDWDHLAEEGSATYWELYLDLLLVAAASSIADQFKNHITIQGCYEFVIYYVLIINIWMKYTILITTRFEDSSFLHALILFVYFFGFGVCIVNVSYEQIESFCIGGIIIQSSILVMLFNIWYSIPRGQYFSSSLAIPTIVSILGFAFTWYNGNRIGLYIAGGFEILYELSIPCIMQGQRAVPMNIEQTKERLGTLVLVMMGETILSVTLEYGRFKEERGNEEDVGVGETHEDDQSSISTLLYYQQLGSAFMLTYMFTLLYFHLQPPTHQHALRRSAYRGIVLYMAHKVLGLVLLAMGVAVKIHVETLLLLEPVSEFAAKLMGYSVGIALLLLFIMRRLHYGGLKEFTFGNQVVQIGENKRIDLMTFAWWTFLGIAWTLPFLGVFTGLTTKDALSSIQYHAVFLFFICFVETFFSHLLQDLLLSHELNNQTEGGQQQRLGEQQNLLQKSKFVT